MPVFNFPKQSGKGIREARLWGKMRDVRMKNIAERALFLARHELGVEGPISPTHLAAELCKMNPRIDFEQMRMLLLEMQLKGKRKPAAKVLGIRLPVELAAELLWLSPQTPTRETNTVLRKVAGYVIERRGAIRPASFNAAIANLNQSIVPTSPRLVVDILKLRGIEPMPARKSTPKASRVEPGATPTRPSEVRPTRRRSIIETDYRKVLPRRRYEQPMRTYRSPDLKILKEIADRGEAKTREARRMAIIRRRIEKVD